jgi:GT2 family glycosyltransferase
MSRKAAGSNAIAKISRVPQIKRGREADTDLNDGCSAVDKCSNGSISTSAELSVVDLVVNIATSGRPDLLRRTLQSLSECKLPAGYRETVVVENGPRAGAEEVVRSARPALKLRYMHTPRSNKSAALNAALRTVGNCLVFFTDDDVRLDPWTLCEYSDTARRRGAGCFYGGPMNVDYDAPPPAWLRQYLPYSAKGWELSGARDCIEKSIRFLGCNWAAFAEDLRAAGGFNVDRGPGSPSGCTGDETDMQDRLLAMGLGGVYVPTACVRHYVPENRCSPDWVIERSYRHGIENGARTVGGNSKPRGVPPWWISYRYLKGILRAGIWSLSGRPELRFKAKNRRSYDRGLLCGIRLQNKVAKMPLWIFR